VVCVWSELEGWKKHGRLVRCVERFGSAELQLLDCGMYVERVGSLEIAWLDCGLCVERVGRGEVAW